MLPVCFWISASTLETFIRPCSVTVEASTLLAAWVSCSCLADPPEAIGEVVVRLRLGRRQQVEHGRPEFDQVVFRPPCVRSAVSASSLWTSLQTSVFKAASFAGSPANRQPMTRKGVSMIWLSGRVGPSGTQITPTTDR